MQTPISRAARHWLSCLALAAVLTILSAACNQGQREAASNEAADAHAGHEHAAESADEHAGHEHGAESHADEEGHAGESPAEHDAHAAGGDEHDHAELIALTPEQLKQYGVKTAEAAGGRLDLTLALPGEAAVNADAVGHVLPRLGGVVQQVTKNIGDAVRKGELLVVLDSRELAEVKAGYLAARERLQVAQANAEREQQLVEKGLSPRQDLINAENVVRELEIQLRASEQSLHALGVSEAQREALVAAPHTSLTRYEVFAPISGRVMEKHVSIGEMVGSDSELFLIADLSSVWINLNVSQEQLPLVKEGQEVLIRFNPSAQLPAEQQFNGNPGLPDARGEIRYIDALIAEDTRKATVRIVLANPQGQWKPGMFVTGYVSVSDAAVAVLVPLASVIKYAGQDTVFVQDDHGFSPQAVQLGRQSATQVEILGGLHAGDRFVVEGAYLVKAEMGKSEAGHGH